MIIMDGDGYGAGDEFGVVGFGSRLGLGSTYKTVSSDDSTINPFSNYSLL